MERLLIALAIAVVAAAIAVVAARRRPDAPTQPRSEVPTQLDRDDFHELDGEGREWLVAVFTSATCQSCESTLAKAAPLASAQVAVVDVEVGAHPKLHRRYGIDAVPTVVVADGEGVVRKAFVGPPTATDLWAAVAEAREPGSTPEPEVGTLQRD